MVQTFSVASTSCLLQRRMLRGTRHYIPRKLTTRRLSSYIWHCHILRSKNHTLLFWRFSCNNKPLFCFCTYEIALTTVCSFCRCWKSFFFIRVSSRFWSKLRRAKYFVPNEIEPERQQNDQATYTKLPQEVAVTVTEANQKVMSENAGTKFVSILQLITRVTILSLLELASSW